MSILVTILILVDGFLQLTFFKFLGIPKNCHNPYFSRWFSAIKTTLKEMLLLK